MSKIEGPMTNAKRMISRFVICTLVLLASTADAGIIIKVRALNPLETEETAAIRYPLPKEIVPEDIIAKRVKFTKSPQEGEDERTTTFNVDYVAEEGRYFIIDEVLMMPREVVTLEAHVNDIWLIPEDRLREIREDVERLVGEYSLSGGSEGSEDEGQDETAAALKDEIFKGLEEIGQRQERSTVLKVGVEDHMSAYYENAAVLGQVEADVSMLRYLLEPEEEESEEAPTATSGVETE